MTDFIIEPTEFGAVFRPRSRAARAVVSRQSYGKDLFGNLHVEQRTGGVLTDPEPWDLVWGALEDEGFACQLLEGSRR